MKRLAFIAFAIGAILFAVLVYYAGVDAVGRALTLLGFGGLALIVLLHLPVIALLGLAWWMVGRDLRAATPWKFIWARFIRESATEVLPFSQVGGFVIGARALTLTGLQALPTAVSMLIDLVLELAAKLPYLVLGIALLLVAKPGSELLRPAGLTVLAMTVGVSALILFRGRLKVWLEEAAIRLASRWPALGLGTHSDIRPAFDRLMTRDVRVLAGFALHLLCWVVGAFETWVVLRLIGVPVTPLEAVVIDSLVSGLRTAGLVVPAALGVQEGGYVLVCAFFGISPAIALALSLARRARELAIGVPGLVAWQAVEGRRPFAASGSPAPGQAAPK